MHLDTEGLRPFYKLAVGMFQAAPGIVYLNQLHDASEAGLTTTQIYIAIANSAAFQSQQFAYSNTAGNDVFAAAFVDNVVGDTVTADKKAEAAAFITSLLNGGTSRGEAMEIALNLLDGVAHDHPVWGDAAALFDNQIDAAIFYTEDLSGDETAIAELKNKIALVTEDPATVTAQNEANSINVGDSFTLTPSVDNIVGTGNNDLISGVFGDATASNNTLTAGDVIDGAGGDDTLQLTAIGTTASAVGVTVKNTEVISIKDFSGATFNAQLVENDPAINFTNTLSTQTSKVTNAGLGSTYGLQGAGNLTVDFANTSGSADTANVALIGAGTSTSARSTIDVSDGNTVEAVNVALSGTNFATLNFGTAAAKATLTGAGTNNLTIGSMAILSTLDASATTGTNTFGLGTTLSTGDKVLGGTGADTISANFTSASLINPEISGVETLSLDFDANATFNLSKTTGATTATISGSKGSATLTNAAADLTKLNVTTQATDSTDNDLTFTYATNTKGDLTLTLGTTATSATDITFDDVTLTRTNSLTLNTTGSKVYVIDDVVLSGAQTKLAVDVGTKGSLTVDDFLLSKGDVGALDVTVGTDASFSGFFDFSGSSQSSALGDVTVNVAADGSSEMAVSGATGIGNLNLTVNEGGFLGLEASTQVGGSIGNINISVLGDDAQGFVSVSANGDPDPDGEGGNIGDITINVDGDDTYFSGSFDAESGGDIGNIAITMAGDSVSGDIGFSAGALLDGGDYVRGGNIGDITVDINGQDAEVSLEFHASGGNAGNVTYSLQGNDARGALKVGASEQGSSSEKNGGNIGDINITLGDNLEFSGEFVFDNTTGLITLTAGNNVSGSLGFSGGEGDAALGDATVTFGDAADFLFVVSGMSGSVSSHTATIGDDGTYRLAYSQVGLDIGTVDVTIGEDTDFFYFLSGNDGDVDSVSVTAGAGSDVSVIVSGGSIDTMGGITLTGGSSSSTGTVIIEAADTFGGVFASAWQGSLTVDLDGVTNGTTVFTGAGGSTVTGTANGDNLFGGAGADSLIGGDGADLILGGAGNDTLLGGAGADTLDGEAGNDRITGGGGNDSITTGAGNDQVRLIAPSANGKDTITDFTVATGTDKFGLLEGGDAWDAAGSAGSAGGTAIVAADYIQTGNAVADVVATNTIYELQTAVTTTEISTDAGGAVNAYVVVFNSTTGRGEVWWDSDWSDAAARVQVATVDNLITLAGVTTMTEANFVEIT